MSDQKNTNNQPQLKPVFTLLTPSMTREQKIANLIAALKKSGIKVNMEG